MLRLAIEQDESDRIGRRLEQIERQLPKAQGNPSQTARRTQ